MKQLILIFALCGSAFAQTFDGPAQLPAKVTFSLTYPSQPNAITCSSNVSLCVTSGGTSSQNATSLQNAVNAAAGVCNSVGAIVSVPLGTYDFGASYLNLPPTNCDSSHWVNIQTANISSLPPQGTRVQPTDAANMPLIEATSNQARVIDAQDYPGLTPVSGYWLTGLNVQANYTGGAAATTYGIRFGDICAGGGNNNSRTDGGCPITGSMTAANLNSRFMIDRSYVHPLNETFTGTYGLVHATGGDAGNVAVEDSTIVALAWTQAQAYATDMTFGPIDFGNNTLEGSGESATELSGDPPPILNAVPQDLYWHHNYITKPLAWEYLCQVSGGVCGNGTAQIDRRNWWECKSGQRVLLEGNYFKTDNTAFYGIAINPVDATGFNIYGWATCNDMTFRYNWFDSGSAMFGLGGPGGLGNQAQNLANEGTTGTQLNHLVKGTGGATNFIAYFAGTLRGIITSTGDTSGVLGICTSGCGTTGSAVITINQNNTPCVFDNGITTNDYVQISSSVAGDCHDAGASKPSSGQIIGQVTSATNASPGTYNLSFTIQDSSGIPGFDGIAPRRISIHDNVAENISSFWFPGYILTGVTVSGGNAVYSYSSYGGNAVASAGGGNPIVIRGFMNNGNNGTFTTTAVNYTAQTITVAATTQSTEPHAGTGTITSGHGNFVDVATGDNTCGNGAAGIEPCLMHDISVIHNSIVSTDVNESGHCFDLNSSSGQLTNSLAYKWRFINNICVGKNNAFAHAQGSSNSSPQTWLSFAVSDPGAASGTGSAFDYNIVTNLATIGFSASNFIPNACNFSGAATCTGTQTVGWAAAMTNVNFTNWNGGTGGWQTNNYQLCAAAGNPSGCVQASIYHNAASDGTDPGANISTVNTMTCGAQTGVTCGAPSNPAKPYIGHQTIFFSKREQR